MVARGIEISRMREGAETDLGVCDGFVALGTEPREHHKYDLERKERGRGTEFGHCTGCLWARIKQASGRGEDHQCWHVGPNGLLPKGMALPTEKGPLLFCPFPLDEATRVFYAARRARLGYLWNLALPLLPHQIPSWDLESLRACITSPQW